MSIRAIYLKLPVAAKLLIPLLAVFSGIWTLGTLSFFQGYLRKSLQDETEELAALLFQDFKQEQKLLQVQARWIADRGDVSMVVAQGNQASILKTLLPIQAALKLDLIKLVDKNGTVLVELKQGAIAQAKLQDRAVSRAASAGLELSDIVSAQPQAPPLLVGTMSIKSEEKIVAGLIIGSVVNEELLHRFREITDDHLVVFQDTQIVASTLASARYFPWQPPTPDLPPTWVEIGQEGYLAKTLLLTGDSGTTIKIVVLQAANTLIQAQQQIRVAIGGFCLLAGAIATIIGIWVAQYLTRRIKALTDAVQLIASGDFVTRIKVDNDDEVGILAQEFNFMAEQLRVRDQQIHSQMQQLEATLKELKQTQTQLVETEKMAALGQLVAGIAHEINTPIGAIGASISNISNSLTQSLQQLPQLFQSLPTEYISDFFYLLEIARQPKEILSFREERQLKRQLKQILQSKGVPNADTLADFLSQMGISTELDRLMPLLCAPDNTFILQTAYQLSVVQNNSQNITLAVERASKIVFALKSYARQDNSGEKVLASVTDGIDTVLMLYQNQIKRGIEVKKAYADVPPILCYPEQLTQVWSNLIHNAIQAMDYQGKLTLAVKQRENYLLVQITDSGCGIPPEMKVKIFEPFFTTKPTGEGSGLGLDIVCKIVDKHGGTVEVESEPGQTTFSVCLPIGQQGS